jgi:hypothetical protein
MTMLDDGPHQAPTRRVGIDQDECRRRLQALPLRAIVAFAARWGLRMERFLDRLSPREQELASRLIRVVVTVACGGLVTNRREVIQAAFRFDLIAWRSSFLSTWHRTWMRWASVREDESQFSASSAALDDAVARCNLTGALAKLAHAALTAESFIASADRTGDFDETLEANKAELIGSALTASATVAHFVGAQKVEAAAAADLDRLSDLVPKTSDWLGFPIDPPSGRLLGPLWPEV